MKTTRHMTFLFVCCILGSSFLVCSADSVSGEMVEKLLPVPGFADGWTNKGKIDIYTEKDLYKYINGEAELYYPYGFKGLATTVYVRSDDTETALVADVYEMGSPMDAFGIYSRYRDPDEEPVSIGTEGFVNESQLLFAKDRYFVRLSLSGKVTVEKGAFLACAQSIARRIPGDSIPLRLLGAFKVPEVVPRTETYIAQAVLGYAIFKRGLTADAKLDGTVVRVFIVLEDSSESAKRVFDTYKAHLEESGAEFSPRTHLGFPTITARDPLYQGLVLMQSGNYLLGAARLADPARAIPMIQHIQSRIPVM